MATEALKITAENLVEFGVMDRIIDEPLGGAHRNPMGSFPFVREAIMQTFRCAPCHAPSSVLVASMYLCLFTPK